MVTVVEPMKVCKLFGAYATVSGVRGAFPLFHSPCGCQYYIRVCMLLHDGIDPVILTSDLSQEDVIYGGEERLKKAILASSEAYDPDLTVVLSSCAPSLVGDDIEAVAEEMQDLVRGDVMAVDCAGFQGDQVSGYKDVILKLLARYARDGRVVKKNLVNLIGIIPGYDYRWRFDVLSLTEMLALTGLQVNAVLGGNLTIDQLETVGSAELNIVLSETRGLEIAEYLFQRFGTPFIHPKYLPIGMQSTKEWLTSIAQHTSNFKRKAIKHKLEESVAPFEYADLALTTTYTVETRVAIVSEPHRAISLARYLTEDIGIKLAAVCVTEANGGTEQFLKDHLEKLQQQDCRVLLTPDNFLLNETLNEIKPDIIYGSSMERAAAVQTGASLIPISYPTYDEQLMTDRPYMGFNGIPVLMEDLVNAIIKREF